MKYIPARIGHADLKYTVFHLLLPSFLLWSENFYLTLDQIELRLAPSMAPITNANPGIESEAIYSEFLVTKKAKGRDRVAFDKAKASKGITIHAVITPKLFDEIMLHKEEAEQREEESKAVAAVSRLPPVPLPPSPTHANKSQSESSSIIKLPPTTISPSNITNSSPSTNIIAEGSKGTTSLWASDILGPRNSPLGSPPTVPNANATPNCETRKRSASTLSDDGIEIIDHKVGQVASSSHQVHIDQEQLRSALAMQSGAKRRALTSFLGESSCMTEALLSLTC